MAKLGRGALGATVGLLFAASAASAAPAPTGELDMYRATPSPSEASVLTDGGYDIANVREGAAGTVFELVLSDAEREALEADGLGLRLIRDAQGRTVSQQAAAQAKGGYEVYDDYDSPGGIPDQLDNLAEKYPDLVDEQVIGQTTEGRDIIAMRVTAEVDSTPVGERPAILYQGTTHAREWISTEVTMGLLRYFLSNADDGGGVEDIVAGRDLWFIPVLNPDGYQFTFDTERLWRKNLRDNDDDNQITFLDGVDLNRNYPERWNYDDEGSETETAGETYRGPSPASEPETQADMALFDTVDFTMVNSYHSYAKLLLYPQGWQVQTPVADDPVYIALSGTDDDPAIKGYDPDIGAELYTTNGEFTDWAHKQKDALAWTTELSQGGCRGCGFVFPDDKDLVKHEIRINRPFAKDIARSAADPTHPISHLGNETEPFYLNTAEVDKTRRHNPDSDFRFSESYGDPQPVQVLAARDLGPVSLHWSIDGGPEQTASTTEWGGGERFGAGYDTYYHQMRGEVTGTDPGDEVEVWFEGGGEESEHFTYAAVSESGADVLIVAAEDYTGTSTIPAYDDDSGPSYLSYYEDAVEAAGYTHDVYDIDAEGRKAPDALGVLGHYDAVVQYTGNDFITREDQKGSASRLANDEMLELRSYLNEGGKVMYGGQWAGYQYAFAYPFDPIQNAPCFAGDVEVNRRCQFLSDDFFQYYLGAYTYNDDAGTEDGEPLDIAGIQDPYDGAAWELNGPGSAGNQLHTASFVSTSSLLGAADYPQYASDAPAEYQRTGAAPFEPFDGSKYMYSKRASTTFKRLHHDLDLTALDPGDDASLSFRFSYDTEPDWDYVFVEARTAGENDWTTLPDENGHTDTDTGLSCPFAFWIEDIHPFLAHYQTHNADGSCSGEGTTGEWNAATGRSDGWEDWNIDLSDYAGKDVELSITYASDSSVQGVGAFVDDVVTSTGEGTTSFEDDGDPTDGWTTPGSPSSSNPNVNDWTRTPSVDFEEGAVVSTPDSLMLGFGLEGIPELADRNDVMQRSLDYLIGD